MIFKIGIIGVGKVVEYQHLPILKILSNVQISFVFDIDQRQAKKIKHLFDVPIILKEELVDQIRNLDVCLIATPLNTREVYLKICAEYDVAVYCEKPFAISFSQHLEYCSWFNDYNICVGFQRRTYINTALLSSVLKSSQFGEIKNIKISQGSYNLKGVNSFVTNSSLYGGMIIESAIHLIDQIIYACDIEDISIQKVTGILSNGLDYDTRIDGLIYSKNQTIPIKMEFSLLRNLLDGIELEFENVKLFLDINPQDFLLVKCSNNSIFKLSTDSGNAINVNQSFILFWNYFFSAIKTKKANFTSARNSLVTTKAVSSIYSKLKINDL